MFEKLFTNLKEVLKPYIWPIVLGILCIVLAVISCIAIKSCSDAQKANNNNIIALTDTIKYYKTKSGEIAASKTLLEGDLSTLKLANDSLYRIVKDMKVSDPSSVVYIKSYVNNPKVDTVWVNDTTTTIEQISKYGSISKRFDFNNQYRELEGLITCTDTTLGLSIDKDKIFLDYTIAIENNKVYVKSSNPYVQYQNISGISLPRAKQPKFSLGVGPTVGYGYDFVAKKGVPFVGVGVSLNYNIFSFGN